MIKRPRLTRTLLVAPVLLALAPIAALAAVAPQPITCPGGLVCLPGVPAPPIRQPVRPAPTPTPSTSPSPAPSPVLPPPGPPEPAPAPLTPNDNLQAVGQWVFGGANWSVCQIPRLIGLSIDPVKCPPEQAVTVKLPEPKDWF